MKPEQAALLRSLLVEQRVLSLAVVADDRPVIGLLSFALSADGRALIVITSPTGKAILIDPFLTKNPKTPPQSKDLATPGKVDRVLVTHQVTISALSDTLADSGTGVLMALGESGRLERVGPIPFRGPRE